MHGFTENTSTALSQMLDPLSESLSVDAAEAIAALQIGPAMQARIQELAERANQGLLTEEEQAEYRGYVEGAEILSLIKLKARRLLNERNRG